MASPHTAPTGAGQQQQVPLVVVSGHEVTRVAVVGPAEEEVTVFTGRVLSAASIALLTGSGGQAARLTAVVLGVPEAALHVTVVVPADETHVTVRVLVTVPFPSRAQLDVVPYTAALSSTAPHLQLIQGPHVHHDGLGGLPGHRVLQEGELGQVAVSGEFLIAVTVTDLLPRLPVQTGVSTGKFLGLPHSLGDHGVEVVGGDVPGCSVESGVG